LSLLLDVEDPIESSYTLEVSSPGLDRPLHELKDYERFVGALAQVKTKQALEGRRRFVGRLLGVEPTGVTEQEQRNGATILIDGDSGPISIPYSAIESARLEVEIRKPSPRKARKRV
jgi:ribosome maturation factor RimP